VKVAVPPLRLAVPRVVEPSRNVTFPVAVDGVTTAVKVTVWPEADGFGETDSAVLVAVPTVSVTAFEVLGPLLESPP